MDPSQVNSFFETKIKDRFGFGLKKEQCKLISQILNGKNSLGIFPTGFGKSVSFYLLPLLFNEIKGDGYICLVISPLKSLMIDQIEKANLYNFQAAGIMSKEEMDTNTIKGFYTLVLYTLITFIIIFHKEKYNNTLSKNYIYIYSLEIIYAHAY
jgi:superfamily II DNA helicase RecQ